MQRGKLSHIIKNVNELMSLCNSLEEKFTKKEAAEKFIGAIVNLLQPKA